MRNIEDLLGDLEEPDEEKEDLTAEEYIKELEERIGILLRFTEKNNIKESVWKARLDEFSYRLNKMFRQKRSIKEILDYFNSISDKIFCEVKILD